MIEKKKIETEFYDPLSKSVVLKQLGQQDILQFLTGSRFLPYLKDDIDITCQFKHVPVDEFEKYGPSCQVSRCERTVTFPVIKKYIDIEESSFIRSIYWRHCKLEFKEFLPGSIFFNFCSYLVLMSFMQANACSAGSNINIYYVLLSAK